MPAPVDPGGSAPEPRPLRPDRTALVLAGGAARGAYEVGVVQHVLEEVGRDLGRPIRLDVLSGTSVGALNACGLAAFADLAPRARMGRVVDVWTKLDVNELVQPDVKGVMAMGARLLGRGAPRADVPVREGGLIAPEGLERLIERSIPFGRIQDNLGMATSTRSPSPPPTWPAADPWSTSTAARSSTVFCWSDDPTTVARAAAGSPRATPWPRRRSPSCSARSRSTATSTATAACARTCPSRPRAAWAPTRVLVVNPRYISTAPLDDSAADGLFPGPLFVLGKTLNALLLDRIDTDLARLHDHQPHPRRRDALRRRGLRGRAQPRAGLRGRWRRASARSARTWCAPLAGHRAHGRRARALSPAFARVGGMAGRLMRRLAEPESRNEADLLSYLLFDGGFAGELIELGRADARARHEELCAFFSAKSPTPPTSTEEPA